MSLIMNLFTRYLKILFYEKKKKKDTEASSGVKV
jgi:hypothetical protein